MTTKYAFYAAMLYCLVPAARAAAQQPPAAPAPASAQTAAVPAAGQPASAAVSSSTVAAPESSGTEQDPALVQKLHELRAQLRAEYHKKRASTPEEARSFRTKAIALSIEYHNMLHKKAEIPLLDNEKVEIHKLIYSHPRIAARIFTTELEICRSTEAYDYRAQAESVYGDADKAEADWTAAIKMSPEMELLRHRGRSYLQRHKYDRAIEDFTAAIKAGGLAPSYHSRALAYFYKDDYAGAAEDLAQFFKVNTDKEYSESVSRSRVCSALRRHGFSVEGCAMPEAGGEKK